MAEQVAETETENLSQGGHDEGATGRPDLATRLRDAYMAYILEEGKQPASVYSFAKSLGISEADFYTAFNSFEVLEKGIFTGFHNQTVATLEADAAYAGYTVRERLLAYYFTLMQSLLANRSYVLRSMKGATPKAFSFTPELLSGMRKGFTDFASQLVAEGIQSSEIKSRPYISDKYAESLWLQLLFVLNFWLADESQGFEKTDAAIEKAVNLSMDLMGSSTVDAAFDFAKFLFQNRK